MAGRCPIWAVEVNGRCCEWRLGEYSSSAMAIERNEFNEEWIMRHMESRGLLLFCDMTVVCLRLAWLCPLYKLAQQGDGTVTSRKD